MALPNQLDKITVSANRYVTAHYIVGTAAKYETSDWQDDMLRAQNAGIDAFALNIAFGDPNTRNSLANAFDAAQSLKERTIQLFLNFDYQAWGSWDIESAATLINRYKTFSSYFTYQGRPVVSTFEGTSNINDWATIKARTGCFFMPNWSSLGPVGAASNSSIIDGLASWDAWPNGPANMTTDPDTSYLRALKGKPYMMPISPCFYTNLAQYQKNWLWRSDSLWHERWLQAVSIQPTFIQIISWNDYGESHYIGPIRPSGIVQGAWYVDASKTHTAWTELLPYYIWAYKRGSHKPFLSTGPYLDNKERLVYWYKPTLSTSGSWQGTTGNNPGWQQTYSPSALSPDLITFTTLLHSPADIRVTIGGTSPQILTATEAGVSQFSLPIPPDQTGCVRFEIVRDGEVVLETKGKQDIVGTAEAVNWNPVVGSSAEETLS